MSLSRGTPTLEEIRRVARTTVAALASFNFKCCLFGSAASSMYGASRVPNDVDVIILSLWVPGGVEGVKRLLNMQDNNFFLVPSTNPRKTYKVLWYKLPTPAYASQRACKVDILVPGIVDIPQIPVDHITFAKMPDIPVVPFLVLLLLKLKGWEDHRNHVRQDMIAKQHVDVQDINELLGMIDENARLDKESWLPIWFVDKARRRVLDYTNFFPRSVDSWRSIGFQI